MPISAKLATRIIQQNGAKFEPEREQWSYLASLVVFVPYEQVLSIDHFPILASKA